jgi:hypothetical protein
MTAMQNDPIDLAGARGAGWEHIDAALRTIAKRRGALDAIEAKWLREALRVKIWREVGCVSMADYLERRLGYAPRTAYDRVRVAMALEQLPKLEAALANGLPHSAVRELTRVATNENEQTWLDAIRGKTVHEIEGMVAGRGKGANPEDPAHPNLMGRTLPFEGVRPATEALLRDARRKAQEERGGGEVISDDDLLATLARTFLDGGTSERTKAPYQVAVTLCEQCGRGWQQSGGRKFELSLGDLARACCDAQHIGSLDADVPERAWQDVSPSVRRQVTRRDEGKCQLPGCRSTRCLEIHHIVARVLGGTHEAENLILLCDACHTALHRGLITISGTASELVVTRRHAIAYELEAAETNAESDAEAVSVQDPVGNRSIIIERSAHVGTNQRHADETVSHQLSRRRFATDEDAPSTTTEPDPTGLFHGSTPIEPTAHVGTNQAHTEGPSRSGRFACEQLRVDARAALIRLGYRPAEAGKAVDLGLRRVGGGSLEELLREALRCCGRR